MNSGGHGVRRVRPTWFLLFTLAWLAIWTVQLTPVQLLLPLQLDTEGHDWIAGVVWAGVVLSVGGFAGVVAGPLAGRLSDRTRSRWGRRRPWAIGGSVVAAAGLLLTGIAVGPLAVGGAWIVVSVGVAVASAAYTALIADQLTAQRGAASAAASSAQAVGIVVGVGAVVLLGLGVTASYVLLAVVIVVVGAGAALLLPDPAPSPMSATAAGAGLGRRRASSLRDRDFRWLLAGRFVVNVGNALGTSLLLFFLMYGLGVPAVEAQDDLLLLIVIYTVFVVIASIVVGILSDRTGRRRLLTVVSALVQAVSGIVIMLSPDLLMTTVAAAIMGAGYGAYMAVSLAFATDLLRDPQDHARDLSVVNVSASLGQLLGPLLGAGLVAVVGGFWLLFVAASVLSVVGAVMTLAVRARSGPAPTAPAQTDPGPIPPSSARGSARR
ncbi:MFS family permease [Microbacterium resistens]|uniref:MFS family permease n=1 Tax=Microbacterium resistens TaxID=156977 RepID=A0ABU1SFH8_9MICO|nr:MFS transporter [Microbacterium resistens]MDR6868322.1 MFS family permease [Microbacterium resistens]